MVPQSGSTTTTTPVVPSVPNPTSSSPHLRIHYLEQLCMTLRREKEQLEGEFGRQRKMFMNHMTELENEISLTKQTNKKLSEEVRELSTQLLYRDEELKSVTTSSKMADAQNREAFDVDRVKYEEEIASLRQILNGEIEGEKERERERERERGRERERERERGRERGGGGGRERDSLYAHDLQL